MYKYAFTIHWTHSFKVADNTELCKYARMYK